MSKEDRTDRYLTIFGYIVSVSIGSSILCFGLLIYTFTFLYSPRAGMAGILTFILVNFFVIVFPSRPPILLQVSKKAFFAAVILMLPYFGSWVGKGRMSIERISENLSDSEFLAAYVLLFFFLFAVELIALTFLLPLRRPEKPSDDNYWL
jgi:hypothetical protein